MYISNNPNINSICSIKSWVILQAKARQPVVRAPTVIIIVVCILGLHGVSPAASTGISKPTAPHSLGSSRSSRGCSRGWRRGPRGAGGGVGHGDRLLGGDGEEG